VTALLVARHAPVASEGICYGRSDVDVRVAHADACERLVGSLVGVAPTIVWSSPSARCRSLGELVAQRFGASLHIDNNLMELDFGAWERKTWSSIANDDRDAYERWAGAFETVAPPGGERTIDLEARVRRWLASLDRATTHALIAHAGVVRALDVIVHRRSWASAMSHAVEHLCWTRFPLDRGSVA